LNKTQKELDIYSKEKGIDFLQMLKDAMKEQGHTTFIDFDGVEKPL
jgi:hypothetical protein